MAQENNTQEGHCCESCQILKDRVEKLETLVEELLEKFECKEFKCIRNLSCALCGHLGCVSCLEETWGPYGLSHTPYHVYVCENCKDVDDDSVLWKSAPESLDERIKKLERKSSETRTIQIHY